ncbi:hypothetical protein A9Q84_18935 [Halobacteriovorax marinus]|uniref:VOC domain-containing protein n=1 Tax=Halobacteriovorax marinus TaxID=97084 RepID=A0A1Y5F280_9BACT|nr:hypothetical protein A9Q84_18935 [Halobacteriovorax marinus]
MISNIILGTDNLERAEKFYDPILEILGAKKSRTTERAIVWSFGEDKTGFAVSLPYDSKPVTSGNGIMVGLTVSSNEKVKAAYDKALELGGCCEGEPGERIPGVFAAYFRDLNGNKLGLFFKN